VDFFAAICHLGQNIRIFLLSLIRGSVVSILFMVITTAPLVKKNEGVQQWWISKEAKNTCNQNFLSIFKFSLCFIWSVLHVVLHSINFTNLVLWANAKFYIWQMLGPWKKSTAGVDVMKQRSSVQKWYWCWWGKKKKTLNNMVYIYTSLMRLYSKIQLWKC